MAVPLASTSNRYRSNAGTGGFITFACCSVVILTLALNASVLNTLMAYTTPGGSLWSKIHPASWVVLFIAPFALFGKRDNFVSRRHLVHASLFAFIIVVLAILAKGAVMTVIIDIAFVPCLFMCVFSQLDHRSRKVIVWTFIVFCLINVFIVVVEFFTSTSLFARETSEPFFRPAALFGHPLNAGMLFCCAMIMLNRVSLSPALQFTMLVFFLVGVVLCGVRGPLVVAATIFISAILHSSGDRGRIPNLLFGSFALCVLMILLVWWESFGIFDRVSTLGVWEQSSQSRAYIFRSFNLLTTNELLWGVSSYEEMQRLALFLTGVPYIENSFVFYVFNVGIILALVICILICSNFASACRRSVSFFILFVGVAIGTISFSTKNATPFGVALASLSITALGIRRGASDNFLIERHTPIQERFSHFV